MLKLMKSLTLTLGQEFRNQLHTNFLRIEDFVNKLNGKLDKHKNEDLNAHSSKQITDDKFGTVEDGLKVVNSRYSNLVLSKGANSLQEVKDARVDNKGVAHLTLFDRLQSDSLRQDYNKDEVMQTVVDAKNQVLAQEFAFDIPNQQWQYLTNLSPWTNAVMQSFWIDNKTGLIYMTQAYLDGYKITKMKSNGQFVSQMYIEGGGHGTHNAYRWHDDKFWIYSFMKDPNGFSKIVRFSYKDNIRFTYGDYDMEEVFTGKPELPYMTPVINQEEDLILYRIQYPESEWDIRNASNYIEVRNLDDVDNGVDNLLYTFDIPRTLTTGTQPMQGVEFGEGKVYWYTGDSNTDNPNFVTVFDLETGEQLFQKQADIGKVGNEYPGGFAEAEGIQLYYDKETGKKALLIGVSTGAGYYRSHSIYGIFMRDVYDKLTAMATPQSVMETGGRTKTFPIKNFTKIGDVIEPGYYYMTTETTKTITDFPLPPQMRDAGFFLEVSAPNVAGNVVQTLTRNTWSRDLMVFKRMIYLDKLEDEGRMTNWNHMKSSSIGGPLEEIPSHITNMNQLGIISNKQWYCTYNRSSEILDHPRPNVAGWSVDVENISTTVFKITLTRVATSSTKVEMYIAYFSSVQNERLSPWTSFTTATV